MKLTELLSEKIDYTIDFHQDMDNFEILDYINSLHNKGWEETDFSDSEWIDKHYMFDLKKVPFKDIKMQGANHPPIVSKYKKMKTPYPPIVIDSDGYIIDGVHRANAAKERGDKFVWAYVGVKNEQND